MRSNRNMKMRLLKSFYEDVIKSSLNNIVIKLSLIIGFILIISSVFANALLTDDLISYYNFNGNVNDSLGVNNGTIQSTIYYNSSCKVGGCYGFNAGTSSVNLTDNPSLYSLTGNFTFSFWIFSNASSPNAYIFSKQSLASVAQPFTFYFDANEKFYIYIGNGVSQVNVVSDNGIAYNQWVHVVITKNNSEIKFYYNGTQSGLTETLGVINPTNSVQALKITNGLGSAGFYGYLDEIGIWNRSLNSSEVAELYNGSSGTTYPFTTPIILNSTISNISFTLNNYYNHAFNINSYTLTFNNNNTNYSTLNGTVYLLNYNTSKLLNISVTNIYNHYNINYTNVNITSTNTELYAYNILNFSNFNIYTTGYVYYNTTKLITWSTPNTLTGSSVINYNVTLNGDYINYTNNNFTSYDFNNHFGNYNLTIKATDENGLSVINYTNVFVRASLTPCNYSFTVNTTGYTINFDVLNKETPNDYLLKMGVVYISDVVPAPVTFYTNKITSFDGFNYINYSHAFNGVYKLYIGNSTTGDTDTLCTLTVCKNNYEKTTQPCIDNLRYVNYTDINNCLEEYDKPVQDYYEDCTVGVESDKEFLFIMILLVLWGMSIIITLTVFPLAVIIAFVSGAGLMFYLIPYFALTTATAGLIVFIVLAITLFSVVIGLRGK